VGVKAQALDNIILSFLLLLRLLLTEVKVLAVAVTVAVADTVRNTMVQTQTLLILIRDARGRMRREIMATKTELSGTVHVTVQFKLPTKDANRLINQSVNERFKKDDRRRCSLLSNFTKAKRYLSTYTSTAIPVSQANERTQPFRIAHAHETCITALVGDCVRRPTRHFLCFPAKKLEIETAQRAKS
jgi:hypothetical protein